jgi:hypothetical protein
MNLLREYIRATLIELNSIGCNSQSLGFIDSSGQFIDIEDELMDGGHFYWIKKTFGTEKAEKWHENWGTPPGWIKVSNANEISTDNINSISSSQVSGLIDMWLSCKKYSRWIQSPETGIVNMYTHSGDQYEELTIPSFIERFAGEHAERLMNKFFSGL